jgi:protein-disulfide isomerase
VFLLLLLTACVAPLTPAAPEGGEAPASAKPTAEAAEEAAAEATGAPTEEATEESTEETVTTDSDGTASVTVEGNTVDTLELSGGTAIPSEETYKGLPVGFTEEGFAYRGSPDAPIVMVEYSDYGCPFCNRHFVQTEPAVDESYVRTGQVRVDVGFARGFNATPSFQVVRVEDGAIFELIGAQPYEQFAASMDSALAGEMPAVAAPEPEQPEDGIPFWATAEGWQPDPERPGYNMAGDQYRGNVDAPLTVIEFSDFQCPFCQRHHTETKPILDEKYVETGKVLWIYKHFPLNIHPQAPAAGAAAECAAEQGLFWEMNDALFADVASWSINDPTPVFEQLGAEIGVDGAAFATCLADPEMLARVEADFADGQQFVQGTPTFIIVRGTQGSIIPGALPEASFSEVLDEELAAAGVTE